MNAAPAARRQRAPRLARLAALAMSAALIPTAGFALGADAAHASEGVDYREVAYAEAKRAGLRSPALFVRQIAAESGYDPRARSYAGAQGIAQIMPATARDWRVDPMKPHAALRAAATNMAAYERQYGSFKLALAAYNAGPGAVQKYGGIPPYRETRDYVRKITRRSTPLPGLDGKDVELRAADLAAARSEANASPEAPHTAPQPSDDASADLVADDAVAVVSEAAPEEAGEEPEASTWQRVRDAISAIV